MRISTILLSISGFNKDVVIRDAIKLCTPALKTHGVFTDLPPCAELNANQDGCEVLSGEQNPATELPGSTNVHLKCYDLDPQTVDLLIGLEDQFSPDDNTLSELDKLCTEAQKIPLIAGTFIPLNSVAILLAGAQMSAAWILPALVASAGVGYGIEIARKHHKDTK